MKIVTPTLSISVLHGSTIKVIGASVQVFNPFRINDGPTLTLQCSDNFSVLPVGESAQFIRAVADHVRSMDTSRFHFKEVDALRALKRELRRFDANLGRFKSFGQ